MFISGSNRSRGLLLEEIPYTGFTRNGPRQHLTKFIHFTQWCLYCTRGHTAKLVKNRSRLELKRHFFSQSVDDGQYSLDQQFIDSTSMSAFKNSLDRMRRLIGVFAD